MSHLLETEQNATNIGPITLAKATVNVPSYDCKTKPSVANSHADICSVLGVMKKAGYEIISRGDFTSERTKLILSYLTVTHTGLIKEYADQIAECVEKHSLRLPAGIYNEATQHSVANQIETLSEYQARHRSALLWLSGDLPACIKTLVFTALNIPVKISHPETIEELRLCMNVMQAEFWMLHDTHVHDRIHRLSPSWSTIISSRHSIEFHLHKLTYSCNPSSQEYLSRFIKPTPTNALKITVNDVACKIKGMVNVIYNYLFARRRQA